MTEHTQLFSLRSDHFNRRTDHRTYIQHSRPDVYYIKTAQVPSFPLSSYRDPIALYYQSRNTSDSRRARAVVSSSGKDSVRAMINTCF